MLDESRKIGTFGHGFTYSGHPVAAAVALKTLEIYARERIAEAGRAQGAAVPGAARCARVIIRWWARRAGSALSARSSWWPTRRPSARSSAKAGVGPRAVRFAEEEGLIVRFLAGDVLSLCPPLIIAPAEIDELFDRLGRALDRTLGLGEAGAIASLNPEAPGARRARKTKTAPGHARRRSASPHVNRFS